jgi:hypothetical protein
MTKECDCCAARPMGSPGCELLFCQVRDAHREEYVKIKSEGIKYRVHTKAGVSFTISNIIPNKCGVEGLFWFLGIPNKDIISYVEEK